MAQKEKTDKSVESVLPGKGRVTIPEGEIADMKREYQRIARKRREVRPILPKK